MNPRDRVTFVVETARAVIEGRLAADEGATALTIQSKQITPLLRSDRDTVTRSEAESVADNLRVLAERVNDAASGLPDPEPHMVIVKTIGKMASSLH